MSFMRRLADRYQSAKLEAEVKFGRKQWGRQPGRATIAATVIRANGSVEQLGTIAECDVEFLPRQGQG